MNPSQSDSPETSKLVRDQLATVGITPTVLAAKLTLKCEELERQRDEAREAEASESKWAAQYKQERDELLYQYATHHEEAERITAENQSLRRAINNAREIIQETSKPEP